MPDTTLELAELLTHAARRLRRGSTPQLAPLGLTNAQARVLRSWPGTAASAWPTSPPASTSSPGPSPPWSTASSGRADRPPRRSRRPAFGARVLTDRGPASWTAWRRPGGTAPRRSSAASTPASATPICSAAVRRCRARRAAARTNLGSPSSRTDGMTTPTGEGDREHGDGMGMGRGHGGPGFGLMRSFRRDKSVVHSNCRRASSAASPASPAPTGRCSSSSWCSSSSTPSSGPPIRSSTAPSSTTGSATPHPPDRGPGCRGRPAGPGRRRPHPGAALGVGPHR